MVSLEYRVVVVVSGEYKVVIVSVEYSVVLEM